MSNERPMFVMSMYANKEALLQAKVDWLEGRVEELEALVGDQEPFTKLDEDGYEVPA